MQSLKSAARRGAIISITALSALALASCSAGHVTQTSDKVAAVDGTSAATEDGKIAVRDVTILVEPDTGAAALKFNAIHQGYKTDVISLDSVTVDGQDVALGELRPLTRDQSIVADSAANLEGFEQHDTDTVQYVPTTLNNEDYGYAGYRPVVFRFSNDTIEVNAAIAATPLQAGGYNRDVESAEGYTTEEPGSSH